MASKGKMQEANIRLARNSLSKKRILIAAKKRATSSGSVPSIRELSASLNASPMALYKHFKNRKNLESELLDFILGEVSLNSAKRDTKARIKDFARSHRETLDKNPWAIPLLYANPSPGINTIRIGEYVLKIITNEGIKGEKAVAIFSSIIALNYGWASFTNTKPREFERHYRQQLQELSQKSQQDLLTTISLTNHLVNFGSGEQYEIALNHLLQSI